MLITVNAQRKLWKIKQKKKTMNGTSFKLAKFVKLTNNGSVPE